MASFGGGVIRALSVLSLRGKCISARGVAQFKLIGDDRSDILSRFADGFGFVAQAAGVAVAGEGGDAALIAVFEYEAAVEGDAPAGGDAVAVAGGDGDAFLAQRDGKTGDRKSVV